MMGRGNRTLDGKSEIYPLGLYWEFDFEGTYSGVGFELPMPSESAKALSTPVAGTKATVTLDFVEDQSLGIGG